MVKPLVPFIEDAWDHEFNEIEHVSIVHAKYGSHHLEKELANSTSDNNKNKNENALKSEDLASLHVIASEYKYDVIINKSISQYSFFKPGNLSIVCISNQGPPPKFS